MKVLIIEDDADIATNLYDYPKSGGYEVDVGPVRDVHFYAQSTIPQQLLPLAARCTVQSRPSPRQSGFA